MARLRNCHTDLASFNKAVNPDLQSRYGAEPRRAFCNDAPTLNVLDAAYGEDSGVLWLMPQLFAVGEFAGVREKMDDVQTRELARTIRSNFGHLSVTELMYFFCRLKAGYYGRFYGVVDPMVITDALVGSFLDERDRWIDIIEREERHRQEEIDAAERKRNMATQEQIAEIRERLHKKWEEELKQQEK